MKTNRIAFLLLGFLACMSLSLFSQDETTTGKIKLKIYVNGINQEDELSKFNGGFYYPGHSYDYKISNFNFGALSFALEINNSKSISQEIEVMPFWYNQQEKTSTIIDSLNNAQVFDGGKFTSYNSTLRYQLNFHFLPEKKIRPYLGLSSQLFYSLFKFEPKVSNSYPFNSQNFGISISVVPGIEFEITKVLSLDLNIPINLYELKLVREILDNPTLSPEDRTKTIIIGDSFPKGLCFRIGLDYKI
jgi:hypothetical protein